MTAILAAPLFGLSTSMWVDASIAEVHTMTMALTLAALLAAVRFGRTGQAGALYWLAFLAGHGLTHQRAFGFLSLGLLVLVLPHWRVVRGSLPVVIGLGLPGHEYGVSWSPDSSSLIFTNETDEDVRLYIVAPDGTYAVPLPDVGGNGLGEWAPAFPVEE